MKQIVASDCLQKIDNHFELVLVASARAKEILSGRSVPESKYKGRTAGVIALMEIADGAVDVVAIEKSLPDLFNNGPEALAAEQAEQDDVAVHSSMPEITEDDNTNILTDDLADGNLNSEED